MASAWVRVVGVVGGGQMGSGIAQLAAAAQLDVILADVDQQALQRGMRNITSSLSKFVKKQALSQVRTRTRRKVNSGFHQNSQFTKAHSKISKSCSNDFSVLFYAIRNPVCPSVCGFCGIRVEGYADGVCWCYNKSELDKFFYFQTVPEFHENAQWKKLLLV
jgi:hypothetical protein